MSHINTVVRIYQKLDEIIHLFFIGIEKVIKGGKIRDFAGAGTYLFPTIHTIGKHQLQRTAHIKERGIVPSIGLTVGLRLNAADDIVGAGIL